MTRLALIFKTGQHPLGVGRTVALAAVGYETMSIGMTEDALQGRVFQGACGQILSHLGMTTGTDLVAGSGGIVDFERRVHRMTAHTA